MIEKFIQAINESESFGLLDLSTNVDYPTGFSGKTLLGALQRLTMLFEDQQNARHGFSLAHFQDRFRSVILANEKDDSVTLQNYQDCVLWQFLTEVSSV